ncbi:MAG: hypothetical protein OEY93_11020 [Anaerolineae bacterium]|nr:hypothetical protein [Anaerolineae bacterium]
MKAKIPYYVNKKVETRGQISMLIDQILRVLSAAMGIAAVTLTALDAIATEYAIIMLGIGMVAMALQHISDK